MPKISVIVPVYNVQQYIVQCLESLIGQTLHDIEIICVDDRGNDGSMDIVREYATRDARIKIVQHKKNSGLSAARNTGIANSTAPYIMCCDSDDFYAPDMCEKMYNAIEESGADAGLCGTHVIYEADEHLRKSDAAYFAIKTAGTFDMDKDFRCFRPVTAWNKIYRRSIIDAHKCEFPAGLKYEDEYFWRVYSAWCKNICTVPDKLYQYRRRAGSIMNQTFARVMASGADYISIGTRYYEYLCAHADELGPQYFDEFWSALWTGWVRTALARCAGFDDATAKIKSDVAAFVTKNYKFGTGDAQTERIMAQMRRGTFMETRRKLFGLYRDKSTDNKREIRVLGIPVWSIKWSGNKIKYRLLGVTIASRYAGRKHKFNIEHFKPCDFDATQLVNTLKQLGRFTYIPNAGNMGDVLIAAATLGFFEQYGIQYTAFDGTQADTIVYGGGGIWVPEYRRDWSRFLPVFAAAKRVVILPSTFRDCPELIDVMDQRFVVFCREQRSYDYIKSQNTGATVLMEHDMAFFMPRAALDKFFWPNKYRCRLRRKLRAAPIKRVARLMRRDAEAAQNISTDVDLSSFVDCGQRTIMRHATFIAQQMLATVDRADVVITDRLHVTIASVLMGKTVYMLDNSNKKLSGVYEYSMKQFTNVHFCETMTEITQRLI